MMTRKTRSGAAKSPGTEPEPFAKARKAYIAGASLRGIQRRFKMTDGEVRDCVPEAFAADDIADPEGQGGY